MPTDSVVVVVGARGCGKTSLVCALAAPAPRLLIWDPINEYAEALGAVTVTDRASLVAALKAAPGRAPARVAYYVPLLDAKRLRAEFDAWARCAYAWRNCTVVAEELAGVTQPGKDRGGWGRLLREGRARRFGQSVGVQVIATTQRPTECDSTIWGQVSRVVVFRLPRLADRQKMASELDLSVDMIPSFPYEWIERDETWALKRGRLVL